MQQHCPCLLQHYGHTANFQLVHGGATHAYSKAATQLHAKTFPACFPSVPSRSSGNRMHSKGPFRQQGIEVAAVTRSAGLKVINKS